MTTTVNIDQLNSKITLDRDDHSEYCIPLTNIPGIREVYTNHIISFMERAGLTTRDPDSPEYQTKFELSADEIIKMIQNSAASGDLGQSFITKEQAIELCKQSDSVEVGDEIEIMLCTFLDELNGRCFKDGLTARAKVIKTIIYEDEYVDYDDIDINHKEYKVELLEDLGNFSEDDVLYVRHPLAIDYVAYQCRFVKFCE